MYRTQIIIRCLVILLIGFRTFAQSPKSHHPIFQYPVPQGEYQVGTRFMVLTDYDRPDIFTKDTSDFRKFWIQIWYPAEPGYDSKPSPYYRKEIADHFIEMGLFESSFNEDVALHASYSFLEAPVNNKRGKFPVLIYSSSGVMNANLFLFENLASHGYVVVSVGHPHWCVFYYNENGEPFFPDYKNNIHYQNMWKEEGSEIVNQTKEKITIAKNANEKKALHRELNNLMPVEISDVRLWTQDFDFVITELSKRNTREALFQGILDLNKIGIFGYSKGGVAAAHACLSNTKYKAGINLSGFMFGDIEDENIKVPFMNIESEESWCVNCEPINDIIYYSAEDDVYMVQVKGATHGNFTDLSAYKDYITTDFNNLLGSIDGSFFHRIQSEYILSFFNIYLKDFKSNLLTEHTDHYDEVRVKFNIRRLQ